MLRETTLSQRSGWISGGFSNSQSFWLWSYGIVPLQQATLDIYIYISADSGVDGEMIL